MSLSQWWRDAIEGPLFGSRWVTLRSGAVVKLDADGRIVQGGPPAWKGVHVQDVPSLARQLRELEGTDCELLSKCRKCRHTFPSREHGLRALLEANPELAAYLEREWGSDSAAYDAWRRSGRRQKGKPELGQGDGRFDALNERWERKGARRISSWLEAVYETVPMSRRWSDFDERLEVLEEATGLDLRLPEDAERLVLQKQSVTECRENLDQAIDELVGRARAGRLKGKAPELEAAPF